MKIIRIETPEGIGIYNNALSEDIINGGTSDPKKWPMPYDDRAFSDDKKYKRSLFEGDRLAQSIRDEYGSADHSTNIECSTRLFDLRRSGLYEFYREFDYRFGFVDFRQMRRWIHELQWLEALDEVGMLLNVYEVESRYTIIGNTQCTFDKTKAILVMSHSPMASEQELEYESETD